MQNRGAMVGHDALSLDQERVATTAKPFATSRSCRVLTYLAYLSFLAGTQFSDPRTDHLSYRFEELKDTQASYDQH